MGLFGEVFFPALLFHGATGENLLFTPGAAPVNLTTQNPVVRLAWFLPVADAGPETGTLRRALDRPFGRPQWRAHLFTATTGAKVCCGREPGRDIESAGKQLFGHGVHIDGDETISSRQGRFPRRS